MPQNGTTPQDRDTDDDLDLFDDQDDPQGTKPLADDEFDDLVDTLSDDEWP